MYDESVVGRDLSAKLELVLHRNTTHGWFASSGLTLCLLSLWESPSPVVELRCSSPAPALRCENIGAVVALGLLSPDPDDTGTSWLVVGEPEAGLDEDAVGPRHPRSRWRLISGAQTSFSQIGHSTGCQRRALPPHAPLELPMTGERVALATEISERVKTPSHPGYRISGNEFWSHQNNFVRWRLSLCLLSCACALLLLLLRFLVA